MKIDVQSRSTGCPLSTTNLSHKYALTIKQRSLEIEEIEITIVERRILGKIEKLDTNIILQIRSND